MELQSTQLITKPYNRHGGNLLIGATGVVSVYLSNGVTLEGGYSTSL